MVNIISVLFAGVVLVSLFRFYKTINSELRIYFWPGLAIKLLAGISLGLVYSYYYTIGDTFTFFEYGQRLVSLLYQKPAEYFRFIILGNENVATELKLSTVQFRSLFFVKIVSALSLVSFNNYWITSSYFSIISFLGCWYLLSAVNKHFSNATFAAVVSFLLIPTFLFWSSGIIKESLAVGALCFISGIYIHLMKKEKLRWTQWVLIVVATIFLWNLKYYWAAIFFSCMVSGWLTLVVVNARFSRLKPFDLITYAVMLVVIILLTSTLHPNFYLNRILNVIVENNLAYNTFGLQSPFIHYQNLNAGWGSIILNSPWALFSCLFRPFIFEATSIFQFFVSIENALLIILLVMNVKYLGEAYRSEHRILIISAVTYIVLLAIFLALSTPNFGTLSRYRVGFLPVFFFLLLLKPASKGFGKFSKLKQP